MNLLSLPEKLVEGHLLPFLEWNDLLRFRKVCKTFQGIVKGYMKVHLELAPEVEINESEKSFARFMKLNIPTTKLFLKNTSDLGHGLYENQWNDAKRFLRKYGPVIKSLRVEQVSLYVYGKELEFLGALVNLEKFEAGHYALGNNMKETVIENLKRANRHPPMTDLIYPVPENFAGLKVLKIGRCTETLRETIFIGDPMKGSTLLEGRNLEYVAPPMGPELLDSNSRWTLLNHFEMLLKKLKLDQPKVERNLKVIDFVHHHDICPGDEGQAIEYFGGMEPMMSSLLDFCVNANVKVKNVSALWFQHLPNPNPELGSVILSLVNLHPNVFLLDMTNLERLEIRQTSRSYVGTEIDWRPAGRRPEWPALKFLDVHVDSGRPQEPYGNVVPHTNFMAGSRILLYFLFTGVTHLALTELRLSFVRGSFPWPNLEHVVASCPNLKKLVLVKWPGSNKALVTLWDGLPGLEEVLLEYCQNLGLGSFVGGDQRNPVFLKPFPLLWGYVCQ